MHILFLHPELDFDDRTARVIASVRAARDAGHEVSVVAQRARRSQPLVEAGASCYEAELPRRRLAGTFATGRLRQQVTALGPDLLHVTDSSLAPLAARLADALQRPYLLELARPLDASLRTSSAWLRAVLLPCATFVESTVNRGGVARSLLRVIEHGPDLERELAPRRQFEERRPVLMSFGTLDRDHGTDVLIQGARLLEGLGRKLCYLILGEGPDEEHLRRQVRELGLSDVMAITAPMMPDLAETLAQADLHVSCARRGNPGWMAVRALGMGIPSIFSGLNSTFPLIEDRVDGLLVERNDPRKLVEAVTTLLDNPEAARKMGVRARERMLALERARAFDHELAQLYAAALGAAVV